MTTLLLLMMFAGRTYHPVAIEKMAANRHTHVETVGYVTYSTPEKDGDRHIRICNSRRVKGMDRSRCIVAEMIPGCFYRPDARLQGMHVRARGISRFDREANHNWWELHPLEGVEILP